MILEVVKVFLLSLDEILFSGSIVALSDLHSCIRFTLSLLLLEMIFLLIHVLQNKFMLGGWVVSKHWYPADDSEPNS